MFETVFSVLGGAANLANFHMFHLKQKPGRQENLVFCLFTDMPIPKKVPLNLFEFLVS